MMVSLVFLLVVVAIAVAVAGRRSGSRERLAPPASATRDDRRATPLASSELPDGLGDHVRRWRSAGLISDEQVRAIEEFEAPRRATGVTPPTVRRIPAVAEVVGYIGAILAVVGLGLIVGRYWSDMNTPVRLVMAAVLAVGLGLAGGAVREGREAALTRLRWFLWLASTAATAVFSVVAVRAVGSSAPRDEVVVFVTALIVGALSGLLWRGRFRPIQEVTTLGSGVVALGALSRLVATPGAMSLGVWVGGAALIWLGISRRVATPFVADLVGASALLVGSAMLLNFVEGPGGLLGTAGALGLLALVLWPYPVADRAEAALLAVMGGVTLLQCAAPTVGYYANHAAFVSGAVVWLVGASALVLSVSTPVRTPDLTRWFGGVVVLGGAAITAIQYRNFGPILGVLTAVALLALGTQPGELMESFIGSVGLLINVPWLIVRLFPGQVRAPVVILITGALFVLLALALAHERERFRRERGSHGGRWLRH